MTNATPARISLPDGRILRLNSTCEYLLDDSKDDDQPGRIITLENGFALIAAAMNAPLHPRQAAGGSAEEVARVVCTDLFDNVNDHGEYDWKRVAVIIQGAIDAAVAGERDAHARTMKILLEIYDMVSPFDKGLGHSNTAWALVKQVTEELTALRAQLEARPVSAPQEPVGVAKVLDFLAYTKRCYASHQMYDKWDINRLTALEDELKTIPQTPEARRDGMVDAWKPDLTCTKDQALVMAERTVKFVREMIDLSATGDDLDCLEDKYGDLIRQLDNDCKTAREAATPPATGDEALKVCVVTRFEKSGAERHGIFSSKEAAEIWMNQQPDLQHVAVWPMVIDCPEFGNEAKTGAQS